MEKKVYLVLHIGENGVVIGTIRVFSSYADACSCCDELNDLSSRFSYHCDYIIEPVPLL